MNAMAFSTMVHAAGRRLPGAARPLPSAHLVAQRARQRRDRRALPRRDAGDAAGRAAVASATASTRCASASAPASIREHHAPFEERFGFPLIEAWAMTETGAGAVRHGQPRAAPCRHQLLRPTGRARRATGSSTTKVSDVPAGDARRAAGARRRRRSARGFFSRLPEGRAGDRGGLGRRLVPHRRRGAARRRRAASTSSTARRT